MPHPSRSNENALLTRAQETDLNVLEKARESIPLMRVHFPSPSDLDEVRIMRRDNSYHMPNHQGLRMFLSAYITGAVFLLQLVEVFSTSQKTIFLIFFLYFQKGTKRVVGFAVIFFNLAKIDSKACFRWGTNLLTCFNKRNV